MNFFQHKVWITAFLCLFNVPFRYLDFFLYRRSVNVKEMFPVVVKANYFVIFKNCVILGVFQKCGNIACNKAFVLADADNKRTSAPRRVNSVGEIFEKYAESVTAAEFFQRFGNGAQRISFRIVVVQQTSDNLAVRLRKEFVAFVCEKFFKFGIVFDYAVMNDCNPAVAVRVRVYVGRFAVCCPTGVTDTAMTEGLSLNRQLFFHSCEFPSRFYGFNAVVFLKNRNSRAVIAAIFQLFQTVHQNVGAVAPTEITNNSAHIISPFRLLFLLLYSPNYKNTTFIYCLMKRYPCLHQL